MTEETDVADFGAEGFISGTAPVETTHGALSSNILAALIQTAKGVHPDPTISDYFARIKYCIRGLSRARLTAEWFAILRSPRLKPLVNANPHILSKLQRPYLHRRLGTKERLWALRRHYFFVNELLGEQLCREMYTGCGLVLANLDLSEAGTYSIRLGYASRFEKEGDLTLTLTDGLSGRPLFSLAFSLIAHGPDLECGIFIGCLQGHKFENQRERIVQMTRAMHGLRPKALLLFALQTLGRSWNVRRLRAVGDTEHIYRRYGRRRNFHAQYNDFWIENHGVQNEDGNFSLPAHHEQRDIATISPNKRSLYRKRYSMMDEIAAQIEMRIGGALPKRNVKPVEKLLTKVPEEAVEALSF